MFVSALINKEYDIVLIINDTFVVEEVAKRISDIRQMKKQAGHHEFDLVYYFPVDHPGEVEHDCTMIHVADRAIAYNKFGSKAAEKFGNPITDIIPHGVDTEVFSPLSTEEKGYCREKYWHISPDTFVFINVNRNTIRKDVAKTILAFSEFKKQVPKSMLYLNMRMIDGSSNYLLDLTTCIKELGLNPKTDVVFPTKFHPMAGFPEKVLNQFYSSADAYISTHLGEGWGLTVVESLAAGTPVIVPNNTSMPDICGDYGYVYPCKEMIYLDAAGYRPVGRLEDILASMYQCHSEWKDNREKYDSRVNKGLEFAKNHSWEVVCRQWVKLFSSLKRHLQLASKTAITGEII
jgi:glycosyltransferase involved in cell wall biosynthesis